MKLQNFEFEHISSKYLFFSVVLGLIASLPSFCLRTLSVSSLVKLELPQNNQLVNSHSLTIHARKQCLAFHGLTFHVSSKM